MGMKTRIIQTKIYKDDYFASLNRAEKLLFLYLLTNERVNLIGIYEITGREIKFDLDLNEDELISAKERLVADKKFVFLNNWVKIINYEKYNNYSGSQNVKAKEKEISLLPKDLIGSIDSVSDFSNSLNNHKSEIRNKKSEIRKSKHLFVEGEVSDEDCQHIADTYHVSLKDVFDKRESMKLWSLSNSNMKTDWKMTLMVWVRDDLKSGKLRKIPEKTSPLPEANPDGLKMLDSLKEKFKFKEV